STLAVVLTTARRRIRQERGLQRECPLLEAGDRALQRRSAALQAGDGFEQGLAGAPQATLGRAGRHSQDFANFTGAHALPVVELDRELEIEWDRAQRLEEDAVLVTLEEHGARRRAQIAQARGATVELFAANPAPMPEELVPGDRQEVGAEAG